MDDGDEKVYLELNLIVHGIFAVIRYCKITLSDVLVSCIQNLRGGFATLSALSTHNLPRFKISKASGEILRFLEMIIATLIVCYSILWNKRKSYVY